MLRGIVNLMQLMNQWLNFVSSHLSLKCLLVESTDRKQKKLQKFLENKIVKYWYLLICFNSCCLLLLVWLDPFIPAAGLAQCSSCEPGTFRFAFDAFWTLLLSVCLFLFGQSCLVYVIASSCYLVTVTFS